jgi:hypothetical protein
MVSVDITYSHGLLFLTAVVVDNIPHLLGWCWFVQSEGKFAEAASSTRIYYPYRHIPRTKLKQGEA